MTVPAEAYEAAAIAHLRARPESWRMNDAELRVVALMAIGTQLRAAVDAVWPLAVAATRRQVAAEIRATFIAGARRPAWSTAGHALVANDIAEWAARIAEGTTHTEEDRHG